MFGESFRKESTFMIPNANMALVFSSMNRDSIEYAGSTKEKVTVHSASKPEYIKSVDLGWVSYQSFDDTGLHKHKVYVSYDISTDTTSYTMNGYMGPVVDLVTVMVAALGIWTKIAMSVIEMLCVNAGITIVSSEIKSLLIAAVSCIRTTYTWHFTYETKQSDEEVHSYYINDATTNKTGKIYDENGYYPEDWRTPEFGLPIFNSLFSAAPVTIEEWSGDYDKNDASASQTYQTTVTNDSEKNIYFGKIDIETSLVKKKEEVICVAYDKAVQTATYEFNSFLGPVGDIANIIISSQNFPQDLVDDWFRRFLLGLNITAEINILKEPFTGTVSCVKTTYTWHIMNENMPEQKATAYSYAYYINDTVADINPNRRWKYEGFQPDRCWENFEFGRYVYSELFHEYTDLFYKQNFKITGWER